MSTPLTDLPRLLRLLQLSSPALPVGAFTWSQGLEAAIAAGWVGDEATLKQWLQLQLQHGLARVDLPLLLRLHAAAAAHDRAALEHWNALALACRESAELLKADLDTGIALVRLFESQQIPLLLCAGNSALSLHAQACVHWDLDSTLALTGWLWAWMENQVVAAIRLMPFGQTAAQQLLSDLQAQVPALIDAARQLRTEEIGASLPGLAIVSMHHETQYSRLFRS